MTCLFYSTKKTDFLNNYAVLVLQKMSVANDFDEKQPTETIFSTSFESKIWHRTSTPRKHYPSKLCCHMLAVVNLCNEAETKH